MAVAMGQVLCTRLGMLLWLLVSLLGLTRPAGLKRSFDDPGDLKRPGQARPATAMPFKITRWLGPPGGALTVADCHLPFFFLKAVF
jgi:hypothetical protein